MDDTDWQFYSFETPKPKAEPIEVKGCCPKCGRKLGKGGHFHVRSCSGERKNIVESTG